MNFREYDWDDINIEHLAEHGVTPQDVEEACFNQPLIMRAGTSRYIVYGRSDSGRYLFIVAIHKEKGLIRIISARGMSKSECKLYNRKRR